MKKVVSLIVVVMLTITGVSYCSAANFGGADVAQIMSAPQPEEVSYTDVHSEFVETAPIKIRGREFEIVGAIPLRRIEAEICAISGFAGKEVFIFESQCGNLLDEMRADDMQCGLAEDIPPEQDDIPLTTEEKVLLQDACEEYEVPYALALAIIEKETNFRNMIGDGGASAGYMQVQQRWHHDRMDRLGVTDLLDPDSNFRVGLDYLSELYGTYGDWNMALTVYNMGHNPGYISDYAVTVMSGYAHWQELLENYA